jgi:tRNA (mo5U34)-methyltransferase
MDKRRQQLAARLPDLETWHHAIDLGDGVTTPTNPSGAYDPELRWKVMRPFLPDDLKGRSVLDLGCNSGYFSVKFKQLGADRVVAVDSARKAIRQATFLSEWFEVDIEIVHKDAHVYCLTCDERFDYVVFLGTFYHLKYGTLVLDRLAEMTRSILFFQTVRMDTLPHSPEVQENLRYPDREMLLSSPEVPRQMFIERRFENDLTNWWVVNHAALHAFLRSAGLEIIEETEPEVVVCRPDRPLGKRVYDRCVFPIYGKKGGAVLPPGDADG